MISKRLLKPIIFTFLVLISILYLSSNHSPFPSALPHTPPEPAPLQNTLVVSPSSQIDTISIDYSKYAYIQYATALDHVCNALMIFKSLEEHGAKADKVLVYPNAWDSSSPPSSSSSSPASSHVETQAREDLMEIIKSMGVKLRPVDFLHKTNAQDSTWEGGYMKLLAWNLTDYSRVLHLDSDGVVLGNMDELFLLPSTPLALPRAYWIAPEPPGSAQKLSAQLVLIQPSERDFARLLKLAEESKAEDYDMELINALHPSNAMVLPHRPYNLLSGEFKKPPKEHQAYLGEGEEWDGEAVLKEAKYLHFSDWPLKKPWVEMAEELFEKEGPKCWGEEEGGEGKIGSRGGVEGGGVGKGDGMGDCGDWQRWRGLYSDFVRRRKNVCGLGLVRRRR